MNRYLVSCIAGFAFAGPAAAIPPAIPPSGPVSGSFKCLFESEEGPYAASFSFREDAPRTEILPMIGERDAAQADLQQFPVDGDLAQSVVFEANGQISIYDQKRKVIGQFARLGAFLSSGEEWIRFRTPNSSGFSQSHGYCVGAIAGRNDRPVTLTRLRFIRIDRVPS